MPMKLVGVDGPCTTQVEMKRGSYVNWKGEHFSGHFEIINEEIKGRIQGVRKYIGDKLWVPAAVAERWMHRDDPVHSLCSVVATRAVDNESPEVEKPVRRAIKTNTQETNENER